MVPAEQKSHRFLELDSLRGLAAFVVVLAHYEAAIRQVPHPFFRAFAHVLGGPGAAVNLFFLLSGFVLTMPYLGRRPPTYAAYLTKRICRIYLPYAAAILIAAFLAAKLYSTAPTGNAWIDMTWSQPFSGRLLLQHLLMIGNFDNTRLNTAIWSLKVEMRVSLVFPLMVFVVKRVPARYLLAACLPVTVLLAFLRSRIEHEFIITTLFCSMLFLVGSIVSLNYRTIQARLEELGNRALCGLFLAGFVLYQVGDLVPIAGSAFSRTLIAYMTTWIIVCGAVVILVISTIWKPLRHGLHNAVLQWVGTRSYSIYLLHGTVLFTFIRLHPGAVLPLSLLLPYIGITLVLSETFHRTVELPTLLLGRRLSAPSKPLQTLQPQ